ncbi:hypothetical protein DFH09DRAFT_1077422 [Mycena vulgaris]|nr:hypothetical protein DFH09DRAFT_1077422 [Mycena vulgaris]
MSLLIEGVFVSSLLHSDSPRTVISAAFLHRLPRATLSKILVTTVVPNHGPSSTVLSCLSLVSLGVDVVLGLDWAACVRDSSGKVTSTLCVLRLPTIRLETCKSSNFRGAQMHTLSTGHPTWRINTRLVVPMSRQTGTTELKAGKDWDTILTVNEVKASANKLERLNLATDPGPVWVLEVGSQEFKEAHETHEMKMNDAYVIEPKGKCEPKWGSGTGEPGLSAYRDGSGIEYPNDHGMHARQRRPASEASNVGEMGQSE